MGTKNKSKNAGEEVRLLSPIKLLRKYYNYNNIVEHSKTTARIALIISKLIKEKNRDLRISFLDVKNAALLHDIDKALTLKQNYKKALKICEKLGIPRSRIKHGLLGYEILKREGLLKYARIAKQHTLNNILNDKTRPKTLLSKIIFYADKRAGDQKVLSISQRIKLWKKRYKIRGEKLKEIMEAKKKLIELEKEIISRTGLSKKDFERALREANT